MQGEIESGRCPMAADTASEEHAGPRADALTDAALLADVRAAFAACDKRDADLARDVRAAFRACDKRDAIIAALVARAAPRLYGKAER